MTASTRPTPDALAFPRREATEQALSAIEAEGLVRGVDLTDPSHFLQLGEVGLALQEMQGGGRGGDAVQGLGALLFHLYHFRRGGEFLLTVERDHAKSLVALGGGGDWAWGGLPSGAGYLQLPRHLFWTAPDSSYHSSSPESAAEAIDGIYWTSSAGETLSLAMISGILEGRPGFTIFELPPVPLRDAHEWPELRAREGGVDFATTLPGGELGGLHSILSLGEVLKLLTRAMVFSSREQSSGAIGEKEDR
jgi:hypothetical protein